MKVYGIIEDYLDGFILYYEDGLEVNVVIINYIFVLLFFKFIKNKFLKGSIYF